MNEPSQDKQTAYFPIRIVSNETGVNAITLRAWERRYGLITPRRTAKGHRLYTEQDIRLIRRVVSLLNRGIPISQAQAIIENGEPEENLPAAAPARPSQWQHYREQLSSAVYEFDEGRMFSLFAEVGQFFPVDVALRFLFLPLYRHLQENSSQYQGAARLRFYSGFLQGRLAARLTEQQGQSGASLVIANSSHDDDIDQLLLTILLRQHNLQPAWFSGLLTATQLTELLQMPRWQALVVRLSATADDQQLIALENLARDLGKPVFVSGIASDHHYRLISRGLIPVLNDLHQEALNIRDMLTGLDS